MKIIKIEQTYYDNTADKITDLLVHLPKQVGEIRDEEYYNKLKRNTKKDIYKRRPMPIHKPTIADIRNEIRLLGKLYNGNPSPEDILIERKNVWQELNTFHNQVEDMLEEKANLQSNDDYLKICKQIDEIISGPNALVEKNLASTLQNIKVPFDVLVISHYSQKDQFAVLRVTLPCFIPIPTIKTVYHSRGTSIKDKLQREINQEESECIFGMAILMGGKAFAASPNIRTVVVAVFKQTQCVLAVQIKQDSFCQEEWLLNHPSILINHFPFLAKKNVVRGALVLNPISETELREFDSRLKYVL